MRLPFIIMLCLNLVYPTIADLFPPSIIYEYNISMFVWVCTMYNFTEYMHQFQVFVSISLHYIMRHFSLALLEPPPSPSPFSAMAPFVSLFFFSFFCFFFVFVSSCSDTVRVFSKFSNS